MLIRSVRHKALKRLILQDDPAGLPRQYVVKIRTIISFLQDMESEDELADVPHWKAHRLTGDRKGTWSLFVSKNWRLTFRIDKDELEILDLDYEDYH
ncbi:plasmid maintenance system killer [Chelativorans sp. ZYF759]|uniref:type II toxin-antitoxin system RelE/ParE family toxin n=1 Tax=Chelativorans sp. ZYF759 TaxID=2692213 RepID=UPI00145EFB79|nr:type II toxin-antitoxin system RelE/ParE family toxin [Chelativorans sp. ZYF759]NMG38850.1 plasmid maintenance system killer [Chelativorans sp. ZYF759]